MMYNHASATKCANPLCSAEFSRTQKITETASNLELIQKTAEKQFQLYDISQVIYSKMGKKGEAAVMRVSYFGANDLIPIKENICFEYTGPLQRKARDWWLQRSDQPCPQSVDIALQMQTSLRKPRQVRVWTNAKFPEITEYIW
jgi:DNA repair protein RadD